MQLKTHTAQQQRWRCRGGRSSSSSSRAASRRSMACAAASSAQQGSLRLFLDSASLSEWERWAPTGTLHGFTTNPLILERDGVPCTLASVQQLAAAARCLGARELQVQAWGGSAAELEASALAVLDVDAALITVKLPCTPDGLAVASSLRARYSSTSITITGVYKRHQALAALAVGADYVAPYLGRMADGFAPSAAAHVADEQLARQRAMAAALDEVADMQAAVSAAGSPTRVLVASLRAADQLAALAARGADTFTFSPAVMQELCCVPETLQAASDFEAAAARNGVAPAASR